MFERLTDRARRVVVLAQEESRLADARHIGTEHLLLGMIHEGEGIAAKVLQSHGVTLETARVAVKENAEPNEAGPHLALGFTIRVKKVFELSLREALRMGHNYVGTEHLLLGLLREDGPEKEILVNVFDLDIEAVRQDTVKMVKMGSDNAEADRPSEMLHLSFTEEEEKGIRDWLWHLRETMGYFGPAHPFSTLMNKFGV